MRSATTRIDRLRARPRGGLRARIRRRWLPILTAVGLTVAAIGAGPGLAGADETASPAARASEADFARVVEAVVDRHVRPVHERFAMQAELLDLEVTNFCAEPSEEGLAAVRRSFETTTRALAALQPTRYGPIAEENRRERLAFWPDPRGIGLRQVQAALAAEDRTVTDPATLAGKSVGLQGLTGLEFLLYGTGADDLMTPGAFRCRYGAAIAANVRTIADEMAAAWEEGGPASRLLTEPGPDNPLFLDHAEAAGEVLASVATALEIITDQKLRPVLGESPDRAKPRLAPFWRSGQTMPMIVSTLEATQHLIEVSGVTDLLAPRESWLGNSILFELGNGTKVARSLTAPVDVIVKDPAAREQAGLLRIVANSLKRSIGRELTAMVGLEQGFNALDGD